MFAIAASVAVFGVSLVLTRLIVDFIQSKPIMHQNLFDLLSVDFFYMYSSVACLPSIDVTTSLVYFTYSTLPINQFTTYGTSSSLEVSIPDVVALPVSWFVQLLTQVFFNYISVGTLIQYVHLLSNHVTIFGEVDDHTIIKVIRAITSVTSLALCLLIILMVV